MTAYALRGLAAARAAGIEGLDRVIASAAQAMSGLLTAGPEDARALGHLALASVGKIDTASYATTFRRRNDDLSVAGLAWLTLAAERFGRSFDRDELIRLLLERRVEAEGLTHWEGRKEDCFTGSDREATALAVQALVATKTASPHAERGLEWLLATAARAASARRRRRAAFVGGCLRVDRAGPAQGFGGGVEVLLDGRVVRTIQTAPRPLSAQGPALRRGGRRGAGGRAAPPGLPTAGPGAALLGAAPGVGRGVRRRCRATSTACWSSAAT